MVAARILAFAASACLTVYWGAVLVKLIRLARKIGKDPNAMPRERVGQIMRLVWYPTILLMLAGAWSAAAATGRSLEDKPGVWRTIHPFLLRDGRWLAAAIPAALLCALCTSLTFLCWRKMGRSWRIGIDPNEKLDLVSTGPYRHVRHPIYALRIVLDLCAIILLPNPVMAATAAIDIAFLHLEARREEKYMEAVHGKLYADYKKNVGRFVPRRRVV